MKRVTTWEPVVELLFIWSLHPCGMVEDSDSTSRPTEMNSFIPPVRLRFISSMLSAPGICQGE